MNNFKIRWILSTVAVATIIIFMWSIDEQSHQERINTKAPNVSKVEGKHQLFAS